MLVGILNPLSFSTLVQFAAQAVAESYFCHSEPFGFAQYKLREESHFQSKKRFFGRKLPANEHGKK
jgi:hypothetical protein